MVVAIGASAAASAAVSYFGLAFPERVGGAQIGPVTDFEKDHPGAGYGVRYLQQGWVIDVYIYDRGVASIPTDVESDTVKNELRSAQRYIYAAQAQGAYSDVKAIGGSVIKDGQGRPRFLCVYFTLVRQNMGTADSYACVTSWNNKFVKFRLTTAQNPGSSDDLSRFLRGWMTVLWPLKCIVAS